VGKYAIEREGDKNTKGTMERKKEKIFHLIFRGSCTTYNNVLPSKTAKFVAIQEEYVMFSSIWYL
jgi:hypothetical protein